MRKIAEKKETVGAGYLTDQGALFLVAGELGVALKREALTSDIAIKDLYIGANDVTTVARVLAVYPISSYKKKDGGEGRYRRLVLFDGPNSVRLTVWDEMADEVERLGAAPDRPVRVVSGYVKQGLDGKPNLNLGKRGGLEVLPDSGATKLPRLSEVTEKLVKLDGEKAYAALECVVDSEGRYSEFVRSDGSPGSLFQFGVKGDGGMMARVVVWSPASRPGLKPGQKVVVTNVRSRRSSSGEFEIHGDSGSTVMTKFRKEPTALRVASVSKSASGLLLLAIDRDRKVRVVEVKGDAGSAEKGGVVLVSPDEETGGRLICLSKGSVEPAGDAGFPGLAELATKLKDARDESRRIMVEVIALSHGTADDIPLKDGTSVKKGELVVGDDTAEMKVVGWKELSEKLLGVQPGERVRISGVSAKGMKMGTWVLEVNHLTTVERLKGKG
jgi:replication factor A1